MKHNIKKVLITGAGSGIGLACVQEFLKAGWDVCAHYCVTVDELLKLKTDYGKRIQILQSDFSVRKELEKFLTLISKEKFRSLVNNAGVHDFSGTAKDPYKSIHELLDINVVAPTLIARKVYLTMKTNGGGSIINVSSIAAHYGSDGGHVFYGISKRGIEALTRTLAREGARFGISVNTVRPGVIDTPFHKKFKKDLKARVEKIPQKRCGAPQEVAKVILDITSHSFMTNQILTISGGE